MHQYTRLPSDFVDRLRDLLCTLHTEQIMMRSGGDEDRLRRIVQLAVKQTGAEVGMLLVVHEDRGDLQVLAAVGDALSDFEQRFVSRSGISGFAIDEAEPIAIANITAGSAGSIDEVDQQTGLRTLSTLAVPLIIHGNAAGAIELRNAPDDKGFSPDDIELTSELAYLAAAAVEEFRGERLLFSLLTSALPIALDPNRASGEGLRDELERWLGELQQDPQWKLQVGLATRVREIARAGDSAAAMASQILDALVKHNESVKEPRV